jgi:hypothetical protein
VDSILIIDGFIICHGFIEYSEFDREKGSWGTGREDIDGIKWNKIFEDSIR